MVEKKRRSYWQLVLDEILNKNSIRRFSYTNVRPKKLESKSQQQCKQRGPLIRIPLGAKFKDTYFSRREAQCMLQLIRGRTVVKAAKFLGLSPRTVEFYVKNMRQKLECSSKFELVSLIMDSDFLKNAKTCLLD